MKAIICFIGFILFYMIGGIFSSIAEVAAFMKNLNMKAAQRCFEAVEKVKHS